MRGGEKGIGGYLSSGLSKHAFRVCFLVDVFHPANRSLIDKGKTGDKGLAVFQVKPEPHQTISADERGSLNNKSDVTAEAKLVAFGDYFVGTFFKRAAAYSVTDLPGVLYQWSHCCTDSLFV